MCAGVAAKEAAAGKAEDDDFVQSTPAPGASEGGWVWDTTLEGLVHAYLSRLSMVCLSAFTPDTLCKSLVRFIAMHVRPKCIGYTGHQ